LFFQIKNIKKYVNLRQNVYIYAFYRLKIHFFDICSTRINQNRFDRAWLYSSPSRKMSRRPLRFFFTWLENIFLAKTTLVENAKKIFCNQWFFRKGDFSASLWSQKLIFGFIFRLHLTFNMHNFFNICCKMVAGVWFERARDQLHARPCSGFLPQTVKAL
jgi:hypothetical protein